MSLPLTYKPPAPQLAHLPTSKKYIGLYSPHHHLLAPSKLIYWN